MMINAIESTRLPFWIVDAITSRYAVYDDSLLSLENVALLGEEYAAAVQSLLEEDPTYDARLPSYIAFKEF